MLALIRNYSIRVQQQAVFISVRRSFVEAFGTGEGEEARRGRRRRKSNFDFRRETRIFRVARLYCIPFRGGAIHFWYHGQTESANALWRGRPLFDVSCSDFVARSRVITRHQKDFSLAKSPCRNASSCHGNVTKPRKFHSWPQSKDDRWR